MVQAVTYVLFQFPYTRDWLNEHLDCHGVLGYLTPTTQFSHNELAFDHAPRLLKPGAPLSAEALSSDEDTKAKSKIRQSKINSRWVSGPIGQTNRQPSI